MRQWIIAIAVFWAGGAGEPAESIDDQLIAMSVKGSAYDPEPLHGLGADGLSELLNRFFPSTAPPPQKAPAEQLLKRWIVELGAEEFGVREEAMRRLMAYARARRELLAAAADSDDAEVRLRARRVLSAWEPRPHSAWEKCLPGFSNYARQIKDRQRLELLARRTAAVLEQGMPASDELKLIRICLAGVAQGGDEASCELLAPLVRHADAKVATLIVETIVTYKQDKTFFPNLFVDALQSDRDQVVAAVIGRVSRSGDMARDERVRQSLRRIFERRSETLKFQACFPLIHEFGDEGAIAYMLAQTQSPDSGRAFAAIASIGDAANAGRPVTKEILASLAPHLESTNAEFRRVAAKALATYAGEEVIVRLIPLLADLQSIIATETERGLLAQPDKPLLRKLLAEAAEKHGDPRVREHARHALDKLNAR
jgi:hypothetical protein